MNDLPEKELCVWLSRHAPSPSQRRSLWDDGYRVVQLSNRWRSAHEAWCEAVRVCGCAPALAVVVMPEAMLCQFIEIASPTPVVRPRMAYADQNHWTGSWQRVYVYPKLGYTPWMPERE